MRRVGKQRHLKHFGILVMLALLQFACGMPEMGKCESSLSAGRYLMSSDCRPLTWGYELPVPFVYGNSLSQDAIIAFNEAIDTWEKRTGIRLFSVIHENYPEYDGIEFNTNLNLIAFRSGPKWSQEPINGDPDKEPGKTVYYHDQNYLYNTDIHVNNGYALSLDGRPETFDLISIAVHELGHTLGLDHTDDPGSVMYPQIMPGQKRREPSPADIQAIRNVYLSILN